MMELQYDSIRFAGTPGNKEWKLGGFGRVTQLVCGGFVFHKATLSSFLLPMTCKEPYPDRRLHIQGLLDPLPGDGKHLRNLLLS